MRIYGSCQGQTTGRQDYCRPEKVLPCSSTMLVASASAFCRIWCCSLARCQEDAHDVKQKAHSMANFWPKVEVTTHTSNGIERRTREDTRPAPGLERLRGGIDGRVELVLGRLGHAREERLRGGVDNVDPLLRGALDELAADVVLRALAGGARALPGGQGLGARAVRIAEAAERGLCVRGGRVGARAEGAACAEPEHGHGRTEECARGPGSNAGKATRQEPGRMRGTISHARRRLKSLFSRLAFPGHLFRQSTSLPLYLPW
jgi:hypothetical protein